LTGIKISSLERFFGFISLKKVRIVVIYGNAMQSWVLKERLCVKEAGNAIVIVVERLVQQKGK